MTAESRPPSPLFALQDLGYRYPDRTEALRGISVTIQAGERLALVGQNGSGKTTLVKQLNGLLRPSSGSVLYNGRPLTGDFLRQARLEIGILFQDPDDQLFGHTVLEDVAFGPRNQGRDRMDAERSARQALEKVNLLDMAFKKPHNLSFGQKKRAALAGLLAMHPRVLILDEPTANLDPLQEEVFLKLVHDFPGTLICISHDVIFLYECCKRALVLDRGRIRHDCTLDELVAQRRRMRAHGLDFSFRFQTAAAPEEKKHSAETETNPGTIESPGSKHTPLVDLQGYHFQYPDGSQALRGIDLRIHDGERLAIVGENGAGKTTLLSCLLGLGNGWGEFFFDGRRVNSKLRKTLWRQTGMVFQDCADQLFCASVREEIGFGPRELGYSGPEVEHRVQRALEQVSLQGFDERVPLHLSGGERKRLSLACVLAMEPRLLILDEPTAGLDPEGEELVLEILSRLEVTLILVTHDLFFVRELTQRTLVMHQGRILRDMNSRDFLRDERLGSLNGLAHSFRQRSSEKIQTLQHEHEHSHPHVHLHEHPHRHGAIMHTHPHVHEHDHAHGFAHAHPDADKAHDHGPRRVHEHPHPGHESEDHEHEH